MSRISYEESQQATNFNSNGVDFFSLADDGDEAIVRILHDDVESFDLVTIHQLSIQNKSRKVDCLRTIRDPMEKCPFCNAGLQSYQRFYIHLLEYTKNESGNIVAQPKIWERSSAYANTLKNLIDEYGPLSDCIFKIHRDGARGDMQTKYSILYGNPNVYKEEYYPKDTSAFDDYSVIGTIVASKTVDEMSYFLEHGEFESSYSNGSNNQVTDNHGSFMNRSTVNDSAPWKNAPPSNAPARPQRFY